MKRNQTYIFTYVAERKGDIQYEYGMSRNLDAFFNKKSKKFEYSLSEYYIVDIENAEFVIDLLTARDFYSNCNTEVNLKKLLDDHNIRTYKDNVDVFDLDEEAFNKFVENGLGNSLWD